ncbi:MAG: cation:proton antiporter [Clostridiales bacterium]|nr:cation:proton antiporter [Clostridiales bacterium]
MLLSLALIVLLGSALGGAVQKLKMPALLGMIATGILLGPYSLNLIAPVIITSSADLRQMALIIILIRAGLTLDLQNLKKVGRPAFLMCFTPAVFELAAVIFFAPFFLGLTYLDAAIMGAVLAAVSPAVVIPRMLKLIESGYGQGKSIPQLIMAGASVDDIFVMVLFTSFIGMRHGGGFDFLSLLKLPVSIILGLAIGNLGGLFIIWLCKKIHMRDTVKILLMLSASFLFVALEAAVKSYVPVSGLLAAMALGATALKKNAALAGRLSRKFSKLWIGAELILFVLVGAAVDINYIGNAGMLAACLIFTALIFRVAGVFICLLNTKLNKKERIFCAISYLPKATVQAAIGGIPLAMGFESGGIILSVAVLAIIITAPIGAVGIDLSYKKLLEKI